MPKLVVKHPGKGPVTVEVENLELEVFQGLVGGVIDVVGLPPVSDRATEFHVYAHEEGLLLGLEPNIRHPLDPRACLVGTVVVSAMDDEGEEVELGPEDRELALLLLEELAV